MALEYVKEAYLKLSFKNILAKKFIKKIEKKGLFIQVFKASSDLFPTIAKKDIKQFFYECPCIYSSVCK